MSFSKHEEFYSLTNIQYKESEKSLQIIMKLFTSETEFALKKYFNKNLELGTELETEETNELLEKYLKLKFNITIDGELKNYKWIGKEFEKDQVFIYLEINDLNKFNTLEVKNSVFTDVFPMQENIVKVKAFNSNKSLVLNKKNDSGILIF